MLSSALFNPVGYLTLIAFSEQQIFISKYTAKRNRNAKCNVPRTQAKKPSQGCAYVRLVNTIVGILKIPPNRLI
jgi:hypothetical protein